MFRLIISTIFIVGALVLVVVFSFPHYEMVKELRVEHEAYREATLNARQLRARRDELLQKYNAIPPSDVERLKKMLPGSIDNVKFIIELDVLSRKYGLPLQNVQVKESQPEETVAVPGEVDVGRIIPPSYGIAGIEFSVEGEYEQFVSFLEDIEKSLRIIDIDYVSFSSNDTRVSGKGYRYDVAVKTYWLK